jgi:hypothetical protein
VMGTEQEISFLEEYKKLNEKSEHVTSNNKLKKASGSNSSSLSCLKKHEENLFIV